LIEYYSFMHNGGAEEYTDNIFLNYGPVLTVLICYVSNKPEEERNSFEGAGGIISSCRDRTFDEVSEMIARVASPDSEYLLFRITDKACKIERHGGIIPYIVKNGELKVLPNGLFGLENDDRIICATTAFYDTLSSTAILADAVTAMSCEEWMDNLVCRISDSNMLSCGNLTAVNFIVRSED